MPDSRYQRGMYGNGTRVNGMAPHLSGGGNGSPTWSVLGEAHTYTLAIGELFEVCGSTQVYTARSRWLDAILSSGSGRCHRQQEP